MQIQVFGGADRVRLVSGGGRDAWFQRWESTASRSPRSRRWHGAWTRPWRRSPGHVGGGWWYVRVPVARCPVDAAPGGRSRRVGMNVSVVVATGVNGDGHREVPGDEVVTTGNAPAWTAFLRGLVARGLSSVQAVTPDALEGLKAATRGPTGGGRRISGRYPLPGYPHPNLGLLVQFPSSVTRDAADVMRPAARCYPKTTRYPVMRLWSGSHTPPSSS